MRGCLQMRITRHTQDNEQTAPERVKDEREERATTICPMRLTSRRNGPGSHTQAVHKRARDNACPSWFFCTGEASYSHAHSFAPSPRPSSYSRIYTRRDTDLTRNTRAPPLHPAALASVPYGIVLVRVRALSTCLVLVCPWAIALRSLTARSPAPSCTSGLRRTPQPTLARPALCAPP